MAYKLKTNQNNYIMKTKTRTKAPVTDFEPRGKSVYVLQVSLESKSSSGIIIAESKNSTTPTGIIVACGPKCEQDLREGIGRYVYFNKFADLQMIDGYNNVLLFMQDDDIRSFVKEDTVIMDGSDKVIKRIDIDRE